MKRHHTDNPTFFAEFESRLKKAIANPKNLETSQQTLLEFFEWLIPNFNDLTDISNLPDQVSFSGQNDYYAEEQIAQLHNLLLAVMEYNVFSKQKDLNAIQEKFEKVRKLQILSENLNAFIDKNYLDLEKLAKKDHSESTLLVNDWQQEINVFFDSSESNSPIHIAADIVTPADQRFYGSVSSMATSTQITRAKIRAYKDQLAKLNHLFDQLDPLSLGAPVGEYNTEVTQLISKREMIENTSDIKNVLHAIFLKQFDKSSADQIVENAALIDQVFSTLKENTYPNPAFEKVGKLLKKHFNQIAVISDQKGLRKWYDVHDKNGIVFLSVGSENPQDCIVSLMSGTYTFSNHNYADEVQDEKVWQKIYRELDIICHHIAQKLHCEITYKYIRSERNRRAPQFLTMRGVKDGKKYKLHIRALKDLPIRNQLSLWRNKTEKVSYNLEIDL